MTKNMTIIGGELQLDECSKHMEVHICINIIMLSMTKNKQHEFLSKLPTASFTSDQRYMSMFTFHKSFACKMLWKAIADIPP